MEIKIDRRYKKDSYTISNVYVDGKRFGDGTHYCSCLEDKDRGLRQDMDLSTIRFMKKPHITAIPSGKYRVEITYSPKFKKNLPLIENVKGFEGIRMHSGNTENDTDGCLLFGWNGQKGKVLNSKYWCDKLFAKIDAEQKKGLQVWLTIEE